MNVAQDQFARLEDFIKKSEKELLEQTPYLELIKLEIEAFIKKNLLDQSNSKNLLLHARVKSHSSLREKIIRKNYHIKYDNEVNLLSELQDLIGLRIVCLLEEDEKKVYSQLIKIFSKKIDDNYHLIPENEGRKPSLIINTKNQPNKQKNGFKIYKMDGIWTTEKDEQIHIELQIKSLSHMFWGEIEHMLFYKNYEYMIGADFYKNLMFSTRKALNNVDYQLAIIKNQLALKNDTEQIEELKQMVTRLIYNKYQPAITNKYGSKLDLREVFEMITFISFRGIIKLSEAYQKTNEIIGRINSQPAVFDPTSYDFSAFNKQHLTQTERLNNMAIFLNDIARGEDVFWKTFFVLYKLIKNQPSFTDIIEDVTKHFMSTFNGLNVQFDQGLDNTSTMIFHKAILDSIVDAFKEYKKIDYFLPHIYQKKIFNKLVQIINDTLDDLYEIEDSDFDGEKQENMYNLVKSLTKIEILLIVHNNIKIDELKTLMEFSEKPDKVWSKDINTKLMNSFIKEKSTVTTNEYLSLFE